MPSTDRWVEITFDCLPLRIGRIAVPQDASPLLEAKIERIHRAIEMHGTHNTYYVHNAKCTYHLTNNSSLGMVQFRFEGTVFTDAEDAKAARADLQIDLFRENCSWLNQAIVDWFKESVHRAVLVEFDSFIAAGDLEKARQRLEAMQRVIDSSSGFVGMYL